MGGTFFLSQPFVGHPFKVAFRRPARCQGHGEMGRGQRGSLPDWPQLIPGNTRKWFRSLQKRPPELEFPAVPMSGPERSPSGTSGDLTALGAGRTSLRRVPPDGRARDSKLSSRPGDQ
jgi:hypothetical protein